MRALTLGQVRELLSGSGATSFLESWAQVVRSRDEALEQIEALTSQLLAAESRERAAQESAGGAAASSTRLQAGLANRRIPSEARSFAEREVEALVRSASARAARFVREATERRQRAREFGERLQELKHILEGYDSTRDQLRREAAALGAFAGESCLFFKDAEHAGGAYVVPLESLHLDGGDLTAFVLHRLPPGADLERAEAVRDKADRKSSLTAAEADPFKTPTEKQAPSRHKRKKEKT